MSFFKKIGRSISSAFKKAPGAISDIFKKAPGVINQISGGLGRVGDVLGSVADVGSKILSNPLVDIGASALLGPEAGVGLAAAGKGLGYLKKGSQIARGASDVIMGSAPYDGRSGSKDVLSGIQKAQKLKDIAGVAGPSFA